MNNPSYPMPKGIFWNNNDLRFVYVIENSVNGKKYVGSSNDFEARKLAHIYALRGGNHSCKALQMDYQRYGDVFSFYVVDSCIGHDCAELEQTWMIKLKTYFDKYGYNTNDPMVRAVRRGRGLTSWRPKIKAQSWMDKTLSTCIAAYNAGLRRQDIIDRYRLATIRLSKEPYYTKKEKG